VTAEVPSDEEEIMKKILASSKISRKDLEKKIKEKQEEYGGLLTKAGAAYSLAKDMGVNMGEKTETKKEPSSSKISEIPESGTVSVQGTVTTVFPVKKMGEKQQERKSREHDHKRRWRGNPR
jgi:ssDNA-binding replication factor A large subunit